ncbi:hypothetical protein MF672_028590 [Actinomadura sp. ATCC 31491]|uniref:Uncharacterized protein n=1 Tax=Actinomadura luzonensis TaxID=2805427 RepID=A0ABT0FZE7_9ACTN|nr:hypothetical protein [Actinomadura luzonensis]MCK2217722.1 hypothetical protein [Actinomadura luzonensis]
MQVRRARAAQQRALCHDSGTSTFSAARRCSTRAHRPARAAGSGSDLARTSSSSIAGTRTLTLTDEVLVIAELSATGVRNGSGSGQSALHALATRPTLFFLSQAGLPPYFWWKSTTGSGRSVTVMPALASAARTASAACRSCPTSRYR